MDPFGRLLDRLSARVEVRRLEHYALLVDAGSSGAEILRADGRRDRIAGVLQAAHGDTRDPESVRHWERIRRLSIKSVLRHRRKADRREAV